MGPSLSPRARGSDSPLALRLLRATTRWSSEPKEAEVLEETHDNDQIIQRVAALDVGMAELGVTRVVMEATSDYWRGVFYLLEAHGFQTWLVNARDVKHLPGRPKT